ncbi:MAG: hypothetical protein ACYC09_06455 [Bacteroidota bacterium]
MDRLKQHKNSRSGWQKLSITHNLLAAGSVIVVLLIVCVFVFLLFADTFVNRYGKPIIIKEITEAYPNNSVRIARMKYSIVQNRFGIDSLSIRSNDGAFELTVGTLDISGISWTGLLLGDNPVADAAKNSIAVAHDISAHFPLLQYESHIEMIRTSVPDSEIVVREFSIHPAGTDEQFFAGSVFRRTRARGVIPEMSVSGVKFPEILQGKEYRARTVRISDPNFNLLVNNDKVSDSLSPNPLMPNEILLSVTKPLHIETVNITNANVHYGELSGIGATPAMISFDSVHVKTEGITNEGDRRADIVIHTRGKFMKHTDMNVIIAIPIRSPDFSFHCYGSVGSMDLRALNTFLEPAEQIRIAGFLNEATFKFDVASGVASGTVRALYKKLNIAAINSRTGSAKGIADRITSFIANTMVIRTNNMPVGTDPEKIGKVHYSRKPDDPFFRYAWFSLRSGIRDIAGF